MTNAPFTLLDDAVCTTNSRLTAAADGTITIQEFYRRYKDGTDGTSVAVVRQLVSSTPAPADATVPDLDEHEQKIRDAKSNLLCVRLSGQFTGRCRDTDHTGPHTGRLQLDIDGGPQLHDLGRMQELVSALYAMPWVERVMIGPSGLGSVKAVMVHSDIDQIGHEPAWHRAVAATVGALPSDLRDIVVGWKETRKAGSQEMKFSKTLDPTVKSRSRIFYATAPLDGVDTTPPADREVRPLSLSDDVFEWTYPPRPDTAKRKADRKAARNEKNALTLKDEFLALPEPQRDDAIRRALAHLAEQSLDDNSCTGVGMCLKAAGYDEQVWIDWDGAKCGHSRAQRLERWAGFPDIGSDDDTSGLTIVAMAANIGHFRLRPQRRHPSVEQREQELKAKQDGAPYPPPSEAHFTYAYLGARVIWKMGDRCVIAIKRDTRDGETRAVIYSVGDHGRLDHGIAVTQAREEAAIQYHTDCAAIGDWKATQAAIQHARKLREPATALRIAESINEARMAYPKAFARAAIVDMDDVDMDLSTIGFPNAVVDLRTGNALDYQEARRRLVAYSLPDPYDPLAQDDKVDKLFPPWAAGDDNPDIRAWQVALGMTFSQRPAREFFAAIGASSAGKTSRMEALARAMGDLVQKISGLAWEKPERAAGPAAHNGDFEVIGPPTRMAYCEEAVRKLHSAFLKDISGGARRFRLRYVRERQEMVPVSAHCWFIGNSSHKSGETVSFGLSGDSADADAMRDRAHILPVYHIPREHRDTDLINLGNTEDFDADTARRHRQAIARRMVEYCQHVLAERDPLDALASLSQWTDAQVRREMPPWMTEWLENAFHLQPGSETTTAAVYTDYLEWHEGNGEGHPVSQRAVTAAVLIHLGLDDRQLEDRKVQVPGKKNPNDRESAARRCPFVL